MVDVGATFAGSDDERAAALAEAHGGVLEQIIPDFRAISANFARLDAIVLTHAHEDHVGGIPALFRFGDAWKPMTRLPIHATPYTLGIVRAKVEETGEKANLKAMHPRKWTRIGTAFEVAPLQVTHSAPETCALVIRTKAGTIVLGSDMKIDPEPVLGAQTDVRGFEMIGAAGVLAFLGDSTNAGHDGRSASEGEVVRGLTKVMREHPGRVVVSTFASNLARLVGVQHAARASQRILGASGRSIERNVDIGGQSGVLRQGDLSLVKPHAMGSLAAGRAAMVCTGTQAEIGSAMRRMADDLEIGRRRHGFSLHPGDLVIHSARVIPGNEATVRAMFDTYRAHGIHVMEAGGPGPVIHASGHAKRDELGDFYRMLNPRFAVPVHGHSSLIEAHLDLAMSMPGVEAAMSPSEGQIMRIAQDGMSIVGRLRLGQLATIAVGGRNAGETKLVAWENATDPGMTCDHSRDFKRGQGRPQQQARPAQPGRPSGHGRGPAHTRHRSQPQHAPAEETAPAPGMR